MTTRRQFLKLGLSAGIVFLAMPWNVIRKMIPRSVLYARTGSGIYPGKQKEISRERMRDSSPYAG